jgi:hypothetical protein
MPTVNDTIVKGIGIGALIVLALALASCSPSSLRAVGLLASGGMGGGGPPDLNVPLVRSDDGSNASLSLTTCIITIGPNSAALVEILQSLTRHGVLVQAAGGGSSRLSINNCPHPIDAAMIREAGQAVRTVRQPVGR